eukprot:370269-Heterocapsa_arctica.AAC.1
MEAVKTFRHALQHASKEPKGNREVVMEVVEKNELALQQIFEVMLGHARVAVNAGDRMLNESRHIFHALPTTHDLEGAKKAASDALDNLDNDGSYSSRMLPKNLREMMKAVMTFADGLRCGSTELQ